MPSAFSQPIYPNLPSNVTDIFSTGENKGFYFSFCEGNLKYCKLKVKFLIRVIVIHVSSLLMFENLNNRRQPFLFTSYFSFLINQFETLFNSNSILSKGRRTTEENW